jgi:hypothetical protein
MKEPRTEENEKKESMSEMKKYNREGRREIEGVSEGNRYSAKKKQERTKEL